MRVLHLLALPWLGQASLIQAEPDSDLDQYGWITPLINVSGVCQVASNSYKEAIDSSWGMNVLDANGRLPLEGFLSDTLDIPINLCDIINADEIQNLPGCDRLPQSVTDINLKLLFGFNKNPGSLDVCLAQDGPAFTSQYCSVNLKVPESQASQAGGPWGRVLAGPRQGGGGGTYMGRIGGVLEAGERGRRWREAGRAGGGRENVTGFTQFQKHVDHLYSLVPKAPAMPPNQVTRPTFQHDNPQPSSLACT